MTRCECGAATDPTVDHDPNGDRELCADCCATCRAEALTAAIREHRDEMTRRVGRSVAASWDLRLWAHLQPEGEPK